jgi:ankyrin repeat protein
VTALHLAVMNDHLNVVSKLVARGADVAVKSSSG